MEEDFLEAASPNISAQRSTRKRSRREKTLKTVPALCPISSSTPQARLADRTSTGARITKKRPTSQMSHLQKYLPIMQKNTESSSYTSQAVAFTKVIMEERALRRKILRILRVRFTRILT